MLQYILAFLIGFVSAALGAVSTGANLISIPALLALGVSPYSAIATTRLSAVSGGLTTIYRYQRSKEIKWHYMPIFVIIAVLAGFIGPHILLAVKPSKIEPLIGVLLLIMLPLLYTDPNFGQTERHTSRLRRIASLPILLIVLIYGTAFGVGGGVFTLYALIYFFGMTITEATATGIVILVVSSLVALITYIGNGQVNLPIGIPLAIGAALGGSFGAAEAIKHGTKWVKTVLALVVLVSGLKLLL